MPQTVSTDSSSPAGSSRAVWGREITHLIPDLLHVHISNTLHPLFQVRTTIKRAPNFLASLSQSRLPLLHHWCSLYRPPIRFTIRVFTLVPCPTLELNRLAPATRCQILEGSSKHVTVVEQRASHHSAMNVVEGLVKPSEGNIVDL